jgi:hypothetical protein
VSFCRLALGSLVPAFPPVPCALLRRAMLCPWMLIKGQKKRWGSRRKRPPHCRAAGSYFFFAFLAFLAAFFAFFAIGPPEGVWLVPDGDDGRLGSESQSFTIRCLSLPPSYHM